MVQRRCQEQVGAPCIEHIIGPGFEVMAVRTDEDVAQDNTVASSMSAKNSRLPSQSGNTLKESSGLTAISICCWVSGTEALFDRAVRNNLVECVRCKRSHHAPDVVSSLIFWVGRSTGFSA